MKGFTLLELMVVVIIISILSAMALPQYQKAVEKSRAAEAITMGKTIIDAQNRSLDAFPNDSVARKGALDVQLSGGTWDTNTADASVYTTQNFTYTLGANGVTIARTGGAMSYSLFMGNYDAQTDNWCSGDICKAMKGMGFTEKTAEEE